MVDAVVSFVVERLGDYLIREAIFFGEVRNEVESLKKDLEWMRCFIKDAENKQVDNDLIRQWVSDIQEIAYDSEDVLDKFMLQTHDEETLNMPSEVAEGETSRQGLFTSIKKCCCLFARTSTHKESNLYSKEIEALKKRLSDLSRRRQEYALENINTKKEGENHPLVRLKQLRKTTSFSFEENVVGYEDETNKLVAKLLDNEPRRFVISMWGTGGLGKTTLASKVYHNHAVKNKFDLCAWVSVSQDYNIQDLLLRIIKSFKIQTKAEELEKMNEEDMERYLQKSLQGHSYLVVIDDVWHKEAWASLKKACPDNKSGSRVIITTRIKDVAQRSDERTHVHELRFLRPEESWQLFCEKAFWDLSVDAELEKLGREMVGKCGGLPLAIVVLGGLLSSKRPQEWHLVRNDIWRNLSNDSIQISSLLALSFNHLPYQLKLCFLYLSHFPEDYEIDTENLIRLWVAEGYIPNDGEIMEDVANSYLNELINRSLIQKEKMHLGTVKKCRLHDLLRDLAIQKAKEQDFFQIYDEMKISACSSLSCRRFAVYSGINRCLWFRQCNPRLRSLSFINLYGEEPAIKRVVSTVCTSFRFVRVLNFERIHGEKRWSLPEDIGKLFHLKYLGLKDLWIDYIPSSILNLSNLETLEIKNYFLIGIPTEICKLQKLRHLIGQLEWQYLRIDNMTNLQTLKRIRGDTLTKTNTEKLVNLRELRISQYDGKYCTFDSIAKLKSLRILSVELSRGEIFFSLKPLCRCRYLLDLRLDGKIGKLPDNMHELLPNLECLSLWNSNLVDDPMPTLEKMLNLTELELQISFYCGQDLVCAAKGFPRLEILRLDASNLEEWLVEEGAMPVLRSLEIKNSRLFKVPERLRSIVQTEYLQLQNPVNSPTSSPEHL